MTERPNYRQRERTRKRLKAMGEPCAICGKPIDYDLDWWIDPKDGKRKKHPLSFEYDHIDPHANGGDNSFANAQAAHRICNQRKGARTKARPRDGGDAQSGDANEPIVTSRAW